MSKLKSFLKNTSLKQKISFTALGIFIVWFLFFALPTKLFNEPTSTVVEDNEGNLLAASIASDGQWRFPHQSKVPQKFKECILHFEDEYFENHLGVNPLSIFRATKQNIKAGKIVSGGSTITMQVIRLARNNSRTFAEKFIELILAIRLELSYSKNEILAYYVSNAPFGGNVVGLEAAAWRYYGRSANKLSWGESATLAVLPNAPSLIYPGKNHELLLAKRNRLLDKLQANNVIDAETCELAKLEELPQKPQPLPRIAPHLLTRLIKEGKQGEVIRTTIDLKVQNMLNRVASNYHKFLSQNEVHNIAIVVTEVNSGKVLGYLGNSDCTHEESGNDVDIVMARRSSGSILKPFLYASLFDEGELLPTTLVPDIPTRISGYAPQNFDKSYDGAVPASNALTRSLNIPAVKLLQKYGLQKFYNKLQKLGFTTIKKPANHYGLSLILGGAETSLWELSGIYSSWARTLNHFEMFDEQYNSFDYRMPYFIASDSTEITPKKLEKTSQYDVSSIWQTFEVLSGVNRPREEKGWDNFSSARKIAWKTGTSFGHRDAWAVGVTPEYTVSVWVGNADGEGRPGLTGVMVAGPILFDVFKKLPETTWFKSPLNNLTQQSVCRKSGYKSTKNCEITDTLWVPLAGLKTAPCPFHKQVFLDKTATYRVNDNCYSVSEMVSKKWFILPPIQAMYYKQKDPNYKSLPALLSNCFEQNKTIMDIVYPEKLSSIFIPKQLDGKQEKVVFEVAHSNTSATIYWHIDESFIGETGNEHKLEFITSVGNHKLTLIDNFGNELIRNFEVIER
ncbi:penicillin-binding protein 1C [Vicingus serpentipes]|uniref:peptidoglycan glycosyltransferase n=1 Tax=Vicingus serpentipes TaxID=1926625 RepID=A0A5C6RQE1_9FLAO|nr:penicillin-binding protein 1C [Vicingus serpentipes]TXB64551.1 penicillin-binding protein 1C [Vicingus serpentipes]